MTTTLNIYALLSDESADPAAAANPVEAPKKKIVQEQPQAVKKAVVGKTPAPKPGKPVVKKTPRNTEKDGEFEEKPEHKDAAAPSKKSHGRPKSGRGREFDRRSNNPKSGEETKKDVAGKATWGDAVDAQLETAEAVVAEEEEVVVAEPDPADSFKSLAQYQAEKEASRLTAQLAVRKPNEGVDEGQWKKLTPLVKEDAVDPLFAGQLSNKEKERKNKAKPAKTVLEIEQIFAPPPREPTSDRGARGGRGKPRGSSGPKTGGRGGKTSGRGGKTSGGAPVNVNDTKAFPDLGA